MKQLSQFTRLFHTGWNFDGSRITGHRVIGRSGRTMAFCELETGRILCEICKAVIGQVSVSLNGGMSTDGMIETNHFAPCGLPCGCEGADMSWLAENAQPGTLLDGTVTGVHVSETYCPRCEPKICPACSGRGMLFLGISIGAYGKGGDRCERCRGSGRVPGRETWEET